MVTKIRIMLILTALFLLAAALAGCGKKEIPAGTAFELYFLNREETSISTETVYLEEGLDQEEQIA